LAGLFAVKWLVAVAIAAIVWALAVYWLQRPMLFPIPPLSYAAPDAWRGAGGEQVWLETSSGRVEAWLLPATANARAHGPLIIYAHGNGELIDFWPDEFATLRAAGLAVLLVEYPGYGRSAGAPSEKTIRETFVAAFDWAATSRRFDTERIVGYGRSLGGGAITQLAAMRPLRALVLESSFTSVADLARGFGVPRAMSRDPFDSIAVVGAFEGPILLMHGRSDAVIPVEHSRKLAKANARAELHEFDCGHNDCAPQWELVRTFLERAGVMSGGTSREP
jgi:pimeloyl-ACP methyl ester carboxylesterase